MISVYQFAINNMKSYIGSEQNRNNMDSQITAFQAAGVLSIAFMKQFNDVLADLIDG